MYRDMQNARARAAEKEGELLAAKVTEFHQPKEAELGYSVVLVKTTKIRTKTKGGGVLLARVVSRVALPSRSQSSRASTQGVKGVYTSPLS